MSTSARSRRYPLLRRICTGGRLATVAALLAFAGLAQPLAADDIQPQQIEQLQKTAVEARSNRASLQKSLDRAQEQAKALGAAIEKLKAELATTKAAGDAAEKQLTQNAKIVHAYEEQKAQKLVKAADEAKAQQKAAADALKVAQEKLRAGHESISRLTERKTKLQAQAAEAEKNLKPQVDAAKKAKEAADLAVKKATEAQATAQKTQQTLNDAKAGSVEAANQLKVAESTVSATTGMVTQARNALAMLSADAVAKRMAAEKTLIALGKLESFSQKVAPILAARCLACHDAKTAKGRFNVETFASLMRGGESGPEFTPGKSGESNLVNLIEDGSMPQDADPLSKDEIAVIRKWIDTGATLDAGLNPTDPLIAIMPSLPQPPAPVAYRVPIPVTAVAFSPDGNQLATSGYHEFILWNAKDGRQLARVSNVAERVYGIQFSPDGKLIVVAAGTPAQLGEVKLFSGESGELVASLVRSSDSIFAVSFSPDGKRLATAGADRAIRVFDVATKKQQLLIEDHADWVMDIAWLPDGSKLISASRDKTAKVFDAKTGDSLVTFNGHAEPVFGVVAAPDGKTVITSGRDKSLRRWNVSDAKEVTRITGFGDEIFRLVVTPDGRIFSCSADRTARLHSLADGKLLKTFSGHSDWVYSLAYNEATKRLATGSFDGEVRVWNVQDGKGLVTFLAAPGYKRPVTTAAK
jgi:WD40 repeat protein/predicted  nucleic acid-binding Zn-ribbon protein